MPTGTDICILCCFVAFRLSSHHASYLTSFAYYIIRIARNVAFIYTTLVGDIQLGLVEPCNIVYNNESSLTWDFASH